MENKGGEQSKLKILPFLNNKKRAMNEIEPIEERYKMNIYDIYKYL